MSRIVVLTVLAFVGCGESHETVAPAIQKSTEPKASSDGVGSFSIDKHLGVESIVDGVLEGDVLILPFEMEYFVGLPQSELKKPGKTTKQGNPLQILFHSIPLAAVADSYAVRQQLLEQKGHRVRLIGTIRRLKVEARPERIGGQQGSSLAIPAHDVYYLVVSSCEKIKPTPNEERME